MGVMYIFVGVWMLKNHLRISLYRSITIMLGIKHFRYESVYQFVDSKFTNFITGTGFMKCIPMKFWGLDTFAASLVIEMLEVFEARTIWSAQGSSLMSPSIFWKIEDFNWYDSLTASIMNSLSLVRHIPTLKR